MHKLARRLIPVVLLPVALAFSSVSSAASSSIVGYAVQVLNTGDGGTGYGGTLVGISSSPTGAVQQYLFIFDRTYAEMAVDAKLHNTKIAVGFTGGAVTDITFQY
jgi:hypothetical protein